MAYRLGECDLEHPYRYSLTVDTDSPSELSLLVVQCNPSVASSTVSDPTVGKVSNWAEENSFRQVVYLNLFALISSRPSELSGKTYDTIVGPRNDDVLTAQLKRTSSKVVVAWGADIPVEADLYLRRVRAIRDIIIKAGHTAHHVGALSYGTHPRHGRMWNRGNRDLRVLSWGAIGA